MRFRRRILPFCSGIRRRRLTHHRSEEYDDHDYALLPPPDIAAAVARGQAAANDGPQPGLDAGRAAQEYAALAQDFRASAWEHLEQGDMDQASKKAWKLVAETVKAISAHYGSVIHSHRAILEVADELAWLVGNAGDMETRVWLNTVFVTARAMHINFYENELPEDTVRDGIVSCVGLSRRFYELFWPGGCRRRPILCSEEYDDYYDALPRL